MPKIRGRVGTKDKHMKDIHHQVAGRTVVVTVPHTIVNDLDKIQRIQKSVLGRLGCLACCSGFDIIFREEMEFRANEKAELVQF